MIEINVLPESTVAIEVQNLATGPGGVLVPATTTTLGGVMVGEGLKVENTGRLSVDTATEVEQGNNKPITSAAVFTEIGNIDVLLATI